IVPAPIVHPPTGQESTVPARRYSLDVTETRTRILLAAATVVRRDGVSALTLEAVAAVAGISKGGLLYHFPSKRRLVDAMVSRRAADFIQAVEERMRSDDTKGPVQAYAAVCADEPPTQLDTALLAGVVEDPAVAETYRDSLEDLQRRVTDAGDPVLAAVVRLAADGLWLSEMLGIDTTPPEIRRAVTERLAALARQAESG